MRTPMRLSQSTKHLRSTQPVELFKWSEWAKATISIFQVHESHQARQEFCSLNSIHSTHRDRTRNRTWSCLWLLELYNWWSNVFKLSLYIYFWQPNSLEQAYWLFKIPEPFAKGQITNMTPERLLTDNMPVLFLKFFIHLPIPLPFYISFLCCTSLFPFGIRLPGRLIFHLPFFLPSPWSTY